MNKLFETFGDLKQYLRVVLDPDRVRTPMQAREALAEAQALVYRTWREHLVAMSADDSLARDFFDLFPFVQFLYQTCQDHCRVEGGAIASLDDDLTIGQVKATVAKFKADLEALKCPQEVFSLNNDYQVIRAVKSLGDSLEPLFEQFLDAQIEGQWSEYQAAKQKSESISDPTKGGLRCDL
jgi:hypothetical protein